MIELAAEQIAAEAGANLLTPGAGAGGTRPARVVIDSREVGGGDLFVGLPGARVDGGEFAAGALAAGAWGVIVTPERAAGLIAGDPRRRPGLRGRRPIAGIAVAGPRLAPGDRLPDWSGSRAPPGRPR